MIEIKRTGQWGFAEQAYRGLGGKWGAARDAGVAKGAQWLAKKVREGLRSGAPAGAKFAPHSPNTLIVRRFLGLPRTKVLIQTAGMLNSIQAVKSSGGWFVGVKRGARGNGGAKLADIAAVHENGVTIVQEMTEKQRRFLHAVFGSAGASGGAGRGDGKLVIRIPARPFFQPILDAYGDGPLTEVVRNEVLSRLGAPFTAAMAHQLRSIG